MQRIKKFGEKNVDCKKKSCRAAARIFKELQTKPRGQTKGAPQILALDIKDFISRPRGAPSYREI
ncbi:MAG: hypothetical protein DBX55_09575 [Verrucomicrobia bacterium]|nr:MAG: hypothetical protein DBX55_09575 [Verrucomicrobiota bacterium]